MLWTRSCHRVCFQNDAYESSEDYVRLAGEAIIIMGALASLSLEVSLFCLCCFSVQTRPPRVIVCVLVVHTWHMHWYTGMNPLMICLVCFHTPVSQLLSLVLVYFFTVSTQFLQAPDLIRRGFRSYFTSVGSGVFHAIRSVASETRANAIISCY